MGRLAFPLSREENFVLAAKIAGARQGRIIFRHMLPFLPVI